VHFFGICAVVNLQSTEVGGNVLLGIWNVHHPKYWNGSVHFMVVGCYKTSNGGRGSCIFWWLDVAQPRVEEVTNVFFGVWSLLNPNGARGSCIFWYLEFLQPRMEGRDRAFFGI